MQLPILPKFLLTKRPPPQWDPFTPGFTRLSKSACTHPIHTIVIIAILASTSYVTMLEHSLFDQGFGMFNYGSPKRADVMAGKVELAVGPETSWKWAENAADKVSGAQNLVLVSLQFPEPSLANSSPVFPEISAQELPSDDPSTKVYAVPQNDLPEFVSSVKALPAPAGADDEPKRQWVMKIGDLSDAQGRNVGLISRIREFPLNVWRLVQVRASIPRMEGGTAANTRFRKRILWT